MASFAPPNPPAQCYSPSNACDSYANFHANLTHHLVADTRSQADGRTQFSASYRKPPGKLNVLGKPFFCSSSHLTGHKISNLEWNPKLINIFTKITPLWTTS